MDPTIDSTRLKYISRCLLIVDKDAPAQLGEDMIYAFNPMRSTLLTIESIDGGNVIPTQPATVRAEVLGRGLNRYKGNITFAEDGMSHNIGADVTVCHQPYNPDRHTDTLRGVLKKVQPYRATVNAKTIEVLASQDLSADPVIYINTDSDCHYMGILDNVRIRMHGNIGEPAYTTFAAAYLKRLARMAKGDVTIDWGEESFVRCTWEVYGLRMSYYIAPRIIDNEKIIKRLDRRIVL